MIVKNNNSLKIIYNQYRKYSYGKQWHKNKIKCNTNVKKITYNLRFFYFLIFVNPISTANDFISNKCVFRVGAAYSFVLLK